MVEKKKSAEVDDNKCSLLFRGLNEDDEGAQALLSKD